jgi:DNA-binding transcriptional LysR family regulator
LWTPWRTVVERGRTVCTSDSPVAYAMMIRAGLGVGLLASINSLNSHAVVLDLDCNTKLPLYLTVLTERLQSKPVRIIYDWLASTLGEQNPWLTEEVDLKVRDVDYINTYQNIING